MIAENLAELVAMNALRRAEHPALAEGDRSITHAELDGAVRHCAALLQRREIGRGTVVGLAMRDGIDHVAMMLAIIRLGAVLLPLDSRWTTAETRNVTRHFAATALVTDAPETCGEDADAPVIAVDASLLAGPFADATFPAGFSSDEPLLLSLSSGTTGIPKGPRLSHRQMMLRLHAEWVSMGFSPHDVNICATPLYFGGGRGFTLSFLSAGATVAMVPPPYRPDEIARVIERHGGTTTFLVPTLLRRVAEAPPEVRAPIQGLRLIISSGSALHGAERASLFERVNRNLVNYYASTEGGGISILESDVGEAAAGSVGRPMLGSEIRIIDDAGMPVPSGTIGNIAHRAPWHPDGFFGNPAETARFFKDGWYLPGDLGVIDANAYLHITGRAKDMIIRGGVNIYPNEIEAVLLSHSAVSDAAVVGKTSAALGEEVAAFVVRSGEVDAVLLAQHCRDTLAPYKVPSTFVFVDTLPRNSGGKVLKAELVRHFERAAS